MSDKINNCWKCELTQYKHVFRSWNCTRWIFLGTICGHVQSTFQFCYSKTEILHQYRTRHSPKSCVFLFSNFSIFGGKMMSFTLLLKIAQNSMHHLAGSGSRSCWVFDLRPSLICQSGKVSMSTFIFMESRKNKQFTVTVTKHSRSKLTHIHVL